MKTKASEDFPEIEWDDLKTELLESDPDERMTTYIATGKGTNGKDYTGTATFFHDEFSEITDIEEI